MSRRPEKHSLTLRGHRTSVSLEQEFWAAFRNAARDKNMTLNELASVIDAERGDVGLASAIRVWILNQLTKDLQKHTPDTASGPDDQI